MKPTASALFALMICLALALPVQAAPAVAIPTFSITNILRDTSITLLTYNFPANQTFEVLMGSMGTRGVGGVRAGTFSSGMTSGSFSVRVDIPAAMRGSYQIAVRVQSQTKPEFFAYNWFYNDGAGSLVSDPLILPSGKPAPTISIAAAAYNASVTVLTHNFPSNHRFNVLMGTMGTRGVGGLLAQTITTSGASQTFTITIPAALRGQPQIAIRFESANGTSGFFAYSWFANNTFGGVVNPIPGPVIPAQPGVKVLPTFTISSVLRNGSVSIYTFNLPPNKTFQATMGALGTRGIGGYLVSTFETGAGGSQALTFTIPPALYGLSEIAIRLQSTTGGYYAYNWFYNR